MKYTFSLLLCLFFLLSACKSTRTAASPEDLASAKIIDSHYETHFDFETLAARLKINYKDEHTSQGVSVSLRMEKDKTIWLSASKFGISLAKAKITPDHVQYYEKIEGTYFDGNFKLLSELLGTELNFEQVQSLLLGQPIFDLSNGGYTAIAGQQNYLIVPKKQRDLFNLFFYLDPQRFTMQQQRLEQKDMERELTISYSEYTAQEIGILPEEVLIRAKEGNKITEIDISYRNVEINEEVSFPFEIPSGYKEIEL